MLDDDARQKRATSPLRVFDVKNERVRAALADAPKIGESLCDACRAHFDAVRALPRRATASRTRSTPTLVRGLDYYTRTTFEFVGPERAARKSTICGGGRYDGLVEADRRPADAGDRLRRRDRAAAARARERGGVDRGAASLDVFFVVDGGDRSRACSRSMAELRAARARAPTPTTPAARSRAS